MEGDNDCQEIELMSQDNLIMQLFETTQLLQREIQSKLVELNLPTEITGQRLRVLWEISGSENLRMSDLAARMGIQPRTVTQFIDALESTGFVTRTPDPLDRRATLLQLTALAQPVVDKFHEVIQIVSKQIATIFSSGEQAVLQTSLSRIVTFLTDSPEGD